MAGGFSSAEVQLRPEVDLAFFNLGVIYTLGVLPVLFFQVDDALCWFTKKTMISDLSKLRRFAGRVALSIFILWPTAILIMVLKLVLNKLSNEVTEARSRGFNRVD